MSDKQTDKLTIRLTVILEISKMKYYVEEVLGSKDKNIHIETNCLPN